jgi:hypothetical protein
MEDQNLSFLFFPIFPRYPGEDNIVEWLRSASSGEFDGLEVTRGLRQPVHVTVLMYLDSQVLARQRRKKEKRKKIS